MYRFFLVFGMIFFSIGSLHAQKSVLGYPEIYKLPKDPYTQGKNRYEEFISERSTLNKDNKRPWSVIVDRSGVKAYEQKPESGNARTLIYGESYYVSEEKGDWVYLIDAQVDRTKVVSSLKPKKIGWVKKKNLLLWSESLVNKRTGIHLKALLLNRLDNIQGIDCDDKTLVRVFQSPTGNTQLESSKIYDFYFVYKKEKNRYLLGRSTSFRKGAVDELLGWVDEGRIALWNTRVALEANIDPLAYAERKQRKSLRIQGFGHAPEAREFNENGQRSNNSEIFWSRDPVDANNNALAASNPYRFRPDFLRFPLLNIDGTGQQLPYFKSAVSDSAMAVIGCDPATNTLLVKSVNQEGLSELRGHLQRKQLSGKHFNIFFAVEGSSVMKAYQPQLASIARTVKAKIQKLNGEAILRFGGLVYQDLAMAGKGVDLENSMELSSDLNKLDRFFRNASFSDGGTSGSAPVMNWGISQALKIANFNSEHTNMLIVLGTKGDFSINLLKKKQAQAKHPELIVERDVLEDKINDKGVNLFGFQCQGGSKTSDREFANYLRGLLLEAAKKHHNKNLQPSVLTPQLRESMIESGIEFPPTPDIADPDYSKLSYVPLEGGILSGGVYRITQAGKALPLAELKKLIGEKTSNTGRKAIELVNQIREFKNLAITLKPGFGPGILAEINRILKNSSSSVAADWGNEKFELYQEVYFARQPKGAEHPSFSYVLFWPDTDLKEYNFTLNNQLKNMVSNTDTERREGLKEVYCKMLAKITGTDKLDCGEYSISELNLLLQGVQKEGVTFSAETGGSYTINDILDRRKVSPEEVQKKIDRLEKILAFLKRTTRGDGDEFVFTRGEKSKFYWILPKDVLF